MRLTGRPPISGSGLEALESIRGRTTGGGAGVTEDQGKGGLDELETPCGPRGPGTHGRKARAPRGGGGDTGRWAEKRSCFRDRISQSLGFRHLF